MLRFLLLTTVFVVLTSADHYHSGGYSSYGGGQHGYGGGKGFDFGAIFSKKKNFLYNLKHKLGKIITKVKEPFIRIKGELLRKGGHLLTQKGYKLIDLANEITTKHNHGGYGGYGGYDGGFGGGYDGGFGGGYDGGYDRGGGYEDYSDSGWESDWEEEEEWTNDYDSGFSSSSGGYSGGSSSSGGYSGGSSSGDFHSGPSPSHSADHSGYSSGAQTSGGHSFGGASGQGHASSSGNRFNSVNTGSNAYSGTSSRPQQAANFAAPQPTFNSFQPMAPSRVRQIQNSLGYSQAQPVTASSRPISRPSVQPSSQTTGATYNGIQRPAGGAHSGQITIQRRPIQPQVVTTLRPVFSQATPSNQFRPLPLSNTQQSVAKGGATGNIGVASLSRAPVKVNSQGFSNQNRVNALTTNAIENSSGQSRLPLRTLSNQNTFNGIQNSQQFVTPSSGLQTVQVGPLTNGGVSSSLGPVRQVFPAQGNSLGTSSQLGSNIITGNQQTRFINNGFQQGTVFGSSVQQANVNNGGFSQNGFVNGGLQQGNTFINPVSQQQSGFTTGVNQQNANLINNGFQQGNVVNTNQQENVVTANRLVNVLSSSQYQQPLLGVTQLGNTGTNSVQTNNNILSSGSLLTTSNGQQGYRYPDAGLSPSLQTTTAASSITNNGQVASSTSDDQISGVIDIRTVGSADGLLQPTGSNITPAFTQTAPTAIDNASGNGFNGGSTVSAISTSSDVGGNSNNFVSVNSDNLITSNGEAAINDEFISIISDDLNNVGSDDSTNLISGTLDSGTSSDFNTDVNGETTNGDSFDDFNDVTGSSDVTSTRSQSSVFDEGLFSLLDSADFSSVEPDLTGPSSSDVITSTSDATAAFDDVTNGGQFIVDGMTFDENGVFTLELVEAPIQGNLRSSVAEFDLGNLQNNGRISSVESFIDQDQSRADSSNVQGDANTATSLGDSDNYDDFSSFDMSTLDFEDASKFDSLDVTNPSLIYDDPPSSSSDQADDSSAATLLASAGAGGSVLSSSERQEKQTRKRDAFWSQWLPGRFAH
ncbi:uncharacterized transmembrane protein DDB_G0289901-like [Amphibalanus amphitrite]|uniref:uncharacterized transmembrane protein DDB_G0289901-like n=1 Tax=Amphibalanus amphitrite TaxID=1232801 RepID=UPI001C91888D|nr:uncharacterized transmembrane protein DDB_G0289901-like [Amphibalanus amphitrite]